MEYSFRHARRLACPACLQASPHRGGRSKTTRRIKSNKPHKRRAPPGREGGYESDYCSTRLVTFVQPLPGRGLAVKTANAPKATRGGPAQRSGPIHTRINDPCTRFPPLDTFCSLLFIQRAAILRSKSAAACSIPSSGRGPGSYRLTNRLPARKKNALKVFEKVWENFFQQVFPRS